MYHFVVKLERMCVAILGISFCVLNLVFKRGEEMLIVISKGLTKKKKTNKKNALQSFDSCCQSSSANVVCWLRGVGMAAPHCQARGFKSAACAGFRGGGDGPSHHVVTPPADGPLLL